MFADRPLELDDKASALLTPEASELSCATSLADLARVEPWTAEATEQAVRAFAERNSLKLGAVAQPLRAALTGRTTSPGIFDVLAVLGKDESLARLADQIPRQRGTACRLSRPFSARLAAAQTRRAGDANALFWAYIDTPVILQCTLGCATPFRPDETVPPRLFGHRTRAPRLVEARQTARMRSWTRKPAPTSRPAR